MSRLLGRDKDGVRITLTSSPPMTPQENPKIIYDILRKHFCEVTFSCMAMANFYSAVSVVGESWTRQLIQQRRDWKGLIPDLSEWRVKDVEWTCFLRTHSLDSKGCVDRLWGDTKGPYRVGQNIPGADAGWHVRCRFRFYCWVTTYQFPTFLVPMYYISHNPCALFTLSVMVVSTDEDEDLLMSMLKKKAEKVLCAATKCNEEWGRWIQISVTFNADRPEQFRAKQFFVTPVRGGDSAQS